MGMKLTSDVETAGLLTLLATAGIANVGNSNITGNIAINANAATAITGLELIFDATHPAYQTSTHITGKVYAVDYGGSTPSILRAIRWDMMSAYSSIAACEASNSSIGYGSRVDRYDGRLTSHTLEAGVYQWNTGVSFSGDLYLQGLATDVFVFNIIHNLIVSSAAAVVLQGGVVPSNVLWRIGGYMEIGTHAHMEGTFYVQAAAILKTGASLHGRIFSQARIALDGSSIITPSYLTAI
jgi:hypothetical protein